MSGWPGGTTVSVTDDLHNLAASKTGISVPLKFKPDYSQVGDRRPFEDPLRIESDTRDVYPYFGIKQEFNSPLDFPPVKGMNKLSFPGQQPTPSNDSVITLWFNSVEGEKTAIRIRPSDTISSLRERIWKMMYSSYQIMQHDDDTDLRVVNAVMANGAEVPISTVEDVPVTSSLPGNAHYSSFRSEPPSLPTGRMERKHVPEAGKYRIPRRCPQVPKELKLFAGAIELEDDEVILSRCVNTGGPPVTEVRRIGSYKLIDQAVIRAEHVLTKAELLMQDREMDSDARGNLPEFDTGLRKVAATVLDPDFYVSTLEQLPGIFADLVSGPPPDDLTCTSNCDEVGRPHVGRLVPIADGPKTERDKRHRNYRAGMAASQARPPPEVPAPSATMAMI